MRLTTLCICGTLLAFLNLSWTTADAGEGVLLGDKGFGPCTATLRPAVPCRHGQDESTCPYLFNLPPLTVHLPKQLRELEKIIKDLQKLKDNVDQLRKMCADCKVSQSERECGREGEREYEMLIEGKHEHKDERSWMNERNPERLQENDRDLKKECGMNRVKAEKTMKGDSDSDLEKRTTLEDKERKKWEAERESDKGPTKEKDGKTQAEGGKGEDKMRKVPAAGGNERAEVREKVVNRNNKEPDRDQEKGGKGNSRGDQEDNLENGKDRKIITNVKSKQRTEESDHHIWRDETKETDEKTRTEKDRGRDRIKMSGDHDGHTNREQEQRREERKKEMEKGIKVERNNERPKQTESIGRAEKEKTIKEGEVEEDREKGKEIKTEEEKTVQSVQRDSDGELASSKAIKNTDFVSISPTPRSIISLTQRPDSMDSDKAITITSSLPSPPLTSSTSHFISDFNEETTVTAYRLPSSNTDLWTAGNAEHHDAESAFRTSRPAATATKIPSDGASSQNGVSSTKATSTTINPLQNLHTTIFPGATARSHGSSKKNISSNTKTGMKPLPAPKPEKHKTGKTKHDKKPQKPTAHKISKPGVLENDQKPKRVRVQIPKPDPRPDSLPTDPPSKHGQDRATDQNPENDQQPRHVQDRTTDQNLENSQNPKSVQDRTTGRIMENDQKPKHVQDRTSDQNLENDQKLKHVQDRTTDQNLENNTESIHSQDSTTDQNLENDQKPKLVEDRTTDQNLENDQQPRHVQDRTTDQNLENSQKPKSVQDRTTGRIMENDQKPKRVQDRTTGQNPENDQQPKHVQHKTTDQNLENGQKPKSIQDRTTGRIMANDQKPKHVQDRTSDQNLENDQKLKHVQDRTTDQNLENNPESIHSQDSTTDQNLENDQKPKRVRDRTTGRNMENDQKPKRVQDRTIDQNLENNPESTHSQDSTTDQNLENDQKPKHVKDSTTDQNLENDQKPKRVQDRTSDQNLENNQIPKRDQDRATDQDLENNPESIHSQDRTTDQNLKNNPESIHSQDRTTDQNLENNQIPKHVQDMTTDQNLENDQKPKHVQDRTSDQNLENDQIPKRDQDRTTDQDLENNQMTHQSQLPILKQNGHQKRVQRPPSIQRPANVNTTSSDKGQAISHTTKPNQNSKLGQLPNLVTGQTPKLNVKPKPNQTPQTNNGLKVPQPSQTPNLSPKSVSDQIPGTESNKTSKRWPPPRHRPPTTPTLQPGATPAKRPKQAVQPKPSQKTKTHVDLPQISRTTTDNIKNSHIDMLPTSRPIKHTAKVSHSPGETEFSPSTMKTISLDPKTSNSLEAGPFPRPHALHEGFTISPNSRIMSDLRPQTASQPSPIPTTTRPNKVIHGILPSVMPSASPGSTKPNPASNGDSSLRVKILHNVEEKAPSKLTIPVLSPSAQPISSVSSDFRSTTLATSGPEAPLVESSTSSARELRVKINQVAAFPSNNLNPNGRRSDMYPEEHLEYNRGGNKPPTLIPSEVTMARRDCSDLLLLGETKSGVYLVTPDLHGRSFRVFCDMELHGGGWTVLQRRQDGRVRFNRTWAEYRKGFGELNGGEFWLGNDMIHLLTRDRDMMLFVELEDFDGVKGYARYDHFRVASERLRYKLTVGGYSGTAGDSLRYGKGYDHNNKWFTTPDRDHDLYPSGNCGAYYSSGWWFDACMAANLNGRYYVGSYKGIRDGIYWGTWHNISTEYYPTNDRQSFKKVRMMIRPKGFTP